MNITSDKVIEFFYLTDEFCKEFKGVISASMLGNAPKRKPLMSEKSRLV